jgi:hypothetical protein
MNGTCAVNCFTEVRETLAGHMQENDLTVAIELLAKIVTEEAFPSLGDRQISSQPSLANDLVERVKKVCQTGFPFSLLESSATEIALRLALESSDSIVSHFMLQEDTWMSEEELDARFGVPFKRLHKDALVRACCDLKKAYTESLKAGYYLLWLIKQAAGCSYEIPTKDSFDDKTVAEVLSQFFTNPSLLNPVNFVEILHYRSSKGEKFFYQEFLDQSSSIAFFNFAACSLQEIALDRWPNKTVILAELLETLSMQAKLFVAEALIASEDLATKNIGNLLTAAFKAPSVTEAIPYFYALREQMPHLNFKKVFNFPFVELFSEKLPDAPAKRLCFNPQSNVIVQDSLMIGVRCAHLLAYDMSTEKMVWAVPIIDNAWNTKKSEAYNLKQIGQYVSIQFLREKTLHLIHLETGEYSHALQFPMESTGEKDRFYVSKEGFAYQIVHEDGNYVLAGGKIVDEKWDVFFKAKNGSGSFRSLSTHCGFLQTQPGASQLVLFDPKGSVVSLLGCMSTKAFGDKLYTIDKDPMNNDRCRLTIRTLKTDGTVLSDIETSLVLDVKKAAVIEICGNGQVILFSRGVLTFCPIFVDLNTGQITYSDYSFFTHAKYITDPHSGDLWTWDERSQEVWKVSRTDAVLMGHLQGNQETSLLHVDAAGYLYFS